MLPEAWLLYDYRNGFRDLCSADDGARVLYYRSANFTNRSQAKVSERSVDRANSGYVYVLTIMNLLEPDMNVHLIEAASNSIYSAIQSIS